MTIEKKTKRPQIGAGKTQEIQEDSLAKLSSERVGSIQQLPISKIQISPHQPRHFFDPQKLEQLTDSVKNHGILENLIVRPLSNGNYELVAGERRLQAAIAAEFTEVPVTVRELTDTQALHLALVENLQRVDLNPIEETEGILKLLSLRLELSGEEVTSLLYHLQNERKGQSTHSVISNSQLGTV
ncbi:MAG TPA: ParB/RepB/Spo0J family partition protein, partial [Allocoleopsis sp.]